jgi:hypothetical protein
MNTPISPMCDYQEMLRMGWGADAVPYVVWPQELIDMVIGGIKERKNMDIVVHLKDGKMEIEPMRETIWDMVVRKHGEEGTMKIIKIFSDSSTAIEK